MSVQWYCQINGQLVGPATSDQLRQLAQQQKLSPRDLVRQAPNGPWTPASQVPGLFAAQPAPANAVPAAIPAMPTATPVAQPATPVARPVAATPATPVARAVPSGGPPAVPVAARQAPPPVPGGAPAAPSPAGVSERKSDVVGERSERGHSKNDMYTMIIIGCVGVLGVVGLVAALAFSGAFSEKEVAESKSKNKPADEKTVTEDTTVAPAVDRTELMSSVGSWKVLPGKPEAGLSTKKGQIVGIRVREAWLATNPTSSPQELGKPGMPFLLVKLEIENKGDQEALYYTSWNGSTSTSAGVVDSNGTTLSPDSDPRSAHLRGRSRQILNPKQKVTDTLVFRAPSGEFDFVRLALPYAAFQLADEGRPTGAVDDERISLRATIRNGLSKSVLGFELPLDYLTGESKRRPTQVAGTDGETTGQEPSIDAINRGIEEVGGGDTQDKVFDGSDVGLDDDRPPAPVVEREPVVAPVGETEDDDNDDPFPATGSIDAGPVEKDPNAPPTVDELNDQFEGDGGDGDNDHRGLLEKE